MFEGKFLRSFLTSVTRDVQGADVKTSLRNKVKDGHEEVAMSILEQKASSGLNWV